MPLVLLASATIRIVGLGALGVFGVNRVLGPTRNAAHFLFLTIGLGLLLNYMLALLGLSLGALEIVEFVAAAVAAFCWRGHLRLIRVSRSTALGLFFCALVFLQALGAPNSCYDARVIWFFFGKVIFYAGHLASPDIWQDLMGYTHPDYPKIVSLVAAQVANDAGLWNEFLPRIALVFFFAASWFGMSALASSWPWRICLGLSFLKIGDLLWNGCIDGYLALFAGIASAYLIHYLVERKKIDLFSAGVALSICGCLKNEGQLLIVAVVAAFGICFLWVERRNLGVRLREIFLPAALSALVFAPVVVWKFYVGAWNLQNDLHLNSAAATLIAVTRLGSSTALKTILGGLFDESSVGTALIVAGLFSLAWWPVRKNTRIAAFLCIAIAIFTAGLFCVYLATPHDLVWHVSESAGRTTLTPMILTFILIASMAVDVQTRLRTSGET